MNPAILSNKLYVPEDYVTREHLDQFTYIIDKCGSPDPEEWIRIQTYSQVGDYVAFCRGDIRKLQKIFGHIPWLDRRSIAPLGFKLSPRIDLFENKLVALRKYFMFPHVGTVADTGWGKTTYIIAKMCILSMRTLVLTHTESIREEWLKRIEHETNIKETEVLLCRRLFGSIKEHKLFPITVATYQTFARGTHGKELLKKARDYFGYVLCDEAHRVPAHTFAKTVLSLNPYISMIGLFGPPIAHG